MADLTPSMENRLPDLTPSTHQARDLPHFGSDQTNVASLRRLFLHKGLQDTKLHQIEADRRKYA